MGLPHAQYHFAKHRGDIGVLSEQFYENEARFLPGNLLLSKIFKGYDGEIRFKQREYNVFTVLTSISLIRAKSPVVCLEYPAVKVFSGYLVFDVLVGNTDRHHENWGIVLNLKGKAVAVTLAPTFDHASSLGRNETEEMRVHRLSTADRRASVEAYAARGRSAFYGTDDPTRTLTTREMLATLMQLHPEHTKFWAERAVALSQEFFAGIFGSVPLLCITPRHNRLRANLHSRSHKIR